MTIIGIGIDLLHIPRFNALLDRRSHLIVARRILSPLERVSFDAEKCPNRRARLLAVRWAVKEAAYKALYPHYRPTWKQLSLTKHESSQKPSLLLHQEGPSTVKLHVSISHDGEYAIAQVLAEDVSD